MAQAFNSVDTLLAPFVKVDNLPYTEVKQCIQSLIYNLNIGSRWGCVKETTQILTSNGFKHYNELNIGDNIYTFVDGEIKEARLNRIVHKQNDYDIMYKLIGDNYVQTVTPEHNCLIDIDGRYELIKAFELEKMIEWNEDIYVPICDYDNSFTNVNKVKINRIETVKYRDYVWCPSTDNKTAIYKDEDGNVFISGNSQPVFSNFTFDWTVPDDLAELNCIVGGVEQDFKYKDCKREMDMINKAFIEVMIEGDADGRGFAYPIKFSGFYR